MNEIQINQKGEPGMIQGSDGGMTISIPIQIKRRSGRKLITLPNGELFIQRPTAGPSPLQLALARGYRWLNLLESGYVGSLKAIADLEQIDARYVSRMVNLTTLAPYLVAAILDGNTPEYLTLFDFSIDPPSLWSEQSEKILHSRKNDSE